MGCRGIQCTGLAVALLGAVGLAGSLEEGQLLTYMTGFISMNIEAALLFILYGLLIACYNEYRNGKKAFHLVLALLLTLLGLSCCSVLLARQYFDTAHIPDAAERVVHVLILDRYTIPDAKLVLFALVSVSFVLITLNAPYRSLVIVLGALVLGEGLNSLLGHMLGIESLYYGSEIDAGVSLLGAVAFCLLGGSIIAHGDLEGLRKLFYLVFLFCDRSGGRGVG